VSPYILIFASVAGSYLLGGIPWGYILVRLVKKVDIRQYGSGNIGATNVRRVAGNAAALAVFGLDVLKGVLAVLLLAPLATSAFEGSLFTPQIICGVSAIAGHMYTPFLRFRGGKGVATGCGVFFAIMPVTALWALGVWVAVVALSRYVSLGSIAAAVALPVIVVLRYSGSLSSERHRLLFSLVVAALVILRHRSNIKRLIQGKEHKIGEKIEPGAP